jgi:hypothetical protein
VQGVEVALLTQDTMAGQKMMICIYVTFVIGEHGQKD